MMDQNQNIRRFQKAADQRLTAAELLLEHGFNLEAIYLAGYAVECSLKCLALKRTPRQKLGAMIEKLTKSGAKGHDFEYLKNILRGGPCNCSIPADVNEAFGRVASWSSDLRYEVGMVKEKEARQFLEGVERIKTWVERS